MNFVNKECVQQTNGYDCGIYLICNAERLAGCAMKKGSISSCDMMVQISPSAKRKEILATIHSLTSSH